jgi:hypothetical protein
MSCITIGSNRKIVKAASCAYYQRLNGDVKDRDMLTRGLDQHPPPIVAGYQIFNN